VTWVKLDDAIGENPKIARLSDSAFALYVTGLAYCNRNLTDGFIPSSVGLGQLRYCEGNAVPAIRELEAGNLWEAVDGGWMVHDYPLYQPPREQVLAEREAARERMAEVRSKHKGSSPSVRPNNLRSSRSPVPVPVPVPEPLKSKARNAAPNGAAVDNRPDHDQTYLAEKLAESWDQELGIPALQKLNNAYGRHAVSDALRSLHGFPPEEAVRSVYAYVEEICKQAVSA